ncbi:homeobox-containing protein 1 isoform X1 [Hippoglossus hippoglossus]|uniref:homeobox-containing protein 1 isoform X1 n=1 Tax=Hippoglossus hippoglossus TaxID=8267 RepID=UPI00148B799A|nr:homeobox-containing protein 1 isoform X1 [Hippoglossus hippoglossus]XP_034455257.1 homeobox-containing protein 1 isoform X1 [Hippoglossus hippoglossus]XP_035039288.1 homeobox-containing protein 1 isoform X1 [Hippoglossus stenolepis]XP_035039289.1 homeobox-containing protein 1 isoform X1 [Hippoglossus stenolepis]
MRQWCVPAATPRTEPLPGRLSVSPPPPDARMECCEVEPRYTIEQIDLLQRLRLSGMTKPQIIHALESLERLDPDHRPSHCDSHPAPSNNTPTTAAPAPSSSSSSSSSSSLSLASATTQTSGLDGAALSPSHSYEASPPPLYTPSVAVQRSFSYDMMGEEEWDLEEKVEEYMRKDSNLVKEEIKTFLNNRRISQAIVGQVTGISQSYISQWLLQQGLEMSDSKRRAFYRWYLLERNNPGLRWSESQHSVSPMPRARGGDRDGTVAGASGSLPNILPNPNTNLNPNPVWSRQRELLMHLLPWYTAAAAAAQAQPGATLSMRSLVKEEPDWRTGIMSGDRTGIVGGPLRLRRGSRFTWRKECQSIMESFFMENQYPDEAKREEIASACNSVIQKPGCKLSEFERVTALKVYNWFANRRKEMKRRANIEAAILESHGIEVPSPSCHSNGEEGEMQEFADQEDASSQRIVDQIDSSSLATTEVAALPSPTPQVLEQKEEDSKRETVDEE